MTKIKLYVISVVALLILGGQIVLAQVLRESPTGKTPSSLVQANGVAAGPLTPVVPVATPLGSLAHPDVGPPGPNGKPPSVPAFKSDDDRSSMRPVGSPAIVPSLANTGPTTPAFTITDVVRYHSAVNTQGVGSYASSVVPSILKIDFLTTQELRARAPMADPGMPDDALLCYVQYAGSFTFIPRYGKPAVYNRAMEVFDAHTGNLLGEGIGPWIK